MSDATGHAADPLAGAFDRLAIRDLLYRYARGVDRRDVALVCACFAPDCRYDGALATGGIAEMLAALPAAMARYARTLHVLGEPLVRLDGDTARADTPALAHHVLAEPAGAVRTVAVRYHDRLARLDGDWKIVARAVHRAR